MAAEYSYVPTQTVEENENILFFEGNRACRKGCIAHRDSSGVFTLKGAHNTCKTIYRVVFYANIAVAEGGTVGEISVALQENGETLGNAIATVTPAAVGEFQNISISTLIVVDNDCCKNISFENVSDGTAIDVINANVIFDRIA